MITHEEAKLYANDCTVESYNFIIDYITQQEKLDIFLQKNLELLGLYQQLAYTFNMAFRNVLKEKIKALETELKGE